MFLVYSRSVWTSLAGWALLAAGISMATLASAQTDLPPIAAPTTSVAVEALPVVRSESQQVTDYARGLVEGLMERENIPYGALAIVTRDRVDMAEVFGNDVVENALFALGSLSDLFGVVATMRLVEQGSLNPAQDLAVLLGDDALEGSTLADLLTQRVDESSALLEEVVRHASAIENGAYISRQVLTPLGMTRSRFEDDLGMLVTVGDMSRFLMAFTNQTALQGQSILMPSTIELMQRRHHSEHPALPGWTYGFAEMQRKGWRALQRDGDVAGSSPFQSRVVIIPELRIAYFVSFSGHGSPEFWRAMDDNLFDKLAAPRVATGEVQSPASSASEAAMDLAGLYRPRARAEDAIFLKAKQEPLRIEADGGVLRLSGAEDLVLRPEASGAWRADVTLAPAAFQDGVFRLGNMVYEPVRAWQRAGTYLVLAAVFGILTFVALFLRRIAPATTAAVRFSSQEIVYGLAGVAAILAALAVALHSWT